ncbi:hypothetical protein C7212DRAFT_345191 [Tuber magnatum]|uniref:Uncharacterized protein n=1 Tax=Tuber magnatum TaxID=42249 RepID=A0A317SX04_9PEZI|nr:hypothetical protein C7212DRAFT_345191 [Tuber magnatum]
MTPESPSNPTDTSPNRRLNTLLARAKQQLEPLNETQQPRTTSASSATMYASTGSKLEELEGEIIKEQYKLIDALENCLEKQRAKIEAQKATIEELRKQIGGCGQYPGALSALSGTREAIRKFYFN